MYIFMDIDNIIKYEAKGMTFQNDKKKTTQISNFKH